MIHETTGSRPWTLALTSVAAFMVVLDMLVVITALPAIRREFGASLAALQWTVNAFTLAFASGIITGAALERQSDALLLAKADPRFEDAICKMEIQPILDVEGVGEDEGALEESQMGLKATNQNQSK